MLDLGSGGGKLCYILAQVWRTRPCDRGRLQSGNARLAANTSSRSPIDWALAMSIFATASFKICNSTLIYWGGNWHNIRSTILPVG